MDSERGRRLSHGQQHNTTIPSPNNYHDAMTSLDPLMSTSTYMDGNFSNAPQHDVSFTASQPQNDTHYMNASSHGQNSSPYMNSFVSQGVMDGSYLNQGMEQNFNNSYVLQDNNYPGSFQDSMNQFTTNVNPADLSKVSSPDNPSPRLLSPDIHTSAPQSPASTNGQFHTPQHSRNTSLDPNSAYVAGDWQNMSFGQHRRTRSDVSDVSSAHNSPYLQHVDIESNHSPLFAAQDSASLGLDQGFDGFTITDHSNSPGSTYVSPRLMPQQEGLGIGQEMILPGYQVPSETYPQEQYQLHSRNESVVSDIGQADQFAPPTINIEPAPVSRQTSFGPQGEEMPDALSPPANSSRGRNRSQSDVTFTRPMSSRSVSPNRHSRQSSTLSVGRSPSPGPMSRSSSPGISDSKISKDRRSSTSAITNNNREYILDLADPNRPNGSAGSSTRVQKHPATFQCTLCPKRFTRAYNLRSHLRTHTDERPFVCTICGKAFARQHDRKRHEGLHSGEKKFVCKGELSHTPGQTWGCGRRFARADALGRHFRSEAGRVCIKPLLDEEAVERRNKMMMEQAQQVQMLQPVHQPVMVPDMNSGFTLPAALLAQYPALQNIDWSALQNQGVDDPGELSDMGVGGGGYDDGGLSDSGTYSHSGQW